MKRILVPNISHLPAAAAEFKKEMDGRKLFAFYGSMGAGKTTFIKALCTELGIKEVATSPTFALVNEYHTSDDRTIYHFDFYRINKIEEVYDFGYEDYFFSGNYCFMEWPEKIESLLPEETVRVNILVSGDEREIQLL